MTASSYSLVHGIPGTDDSRREVMRHVKWQLPRHLLLVSRRDFLSLPATSASRFVVFPPTTTTTTVNPPSKQQQLAPMNEWAITRFVLHREGRGRGGGRGGRRRVDGSAHNEVMGWHPTFMAPVFPAV